MNAAIRVKSERPFSIVVGDRAALQRGHADLELVDVLDVRAVPSEAEAEWMRSGGLLNRPFAVVLFDPRDECLWRAVHYVLSFRAHK
jgi:hypothetical protein